MSVAVERRFPVPVKAVRSISLLFNETTDMSLSHR
jgi:hypothetical protein